MPISAAQLGYYVTRFTERAREPRGAGFATRYGSLKALNRHLSQFVRFLGPERSLSSLRDFTLRPQRMAATRPSRRNVRGAALVTNGFTPTVFCTDTSA